MNPFQEIEQLIPKCHGWCSVERAMVMASAVIAMRPAVSVEIGVWGGRGVIALALAHKLVGGKVIGIDPWDREASIVGQTGENLKWWSSVNHEEVYQDCIKRIGDAGLTHCVEIIRAKSDDVTPPKEITILAIDGNHSDQAMRDVNRYAENIVLGGIVFADDLQWDGGGVLKSVERLTEMGFRKLYDLDTGAVFQRIALSKH